MDCRELFIPVEIKSSGRIKKMLSGVEILKAVWARLLVSPPLVGVFVYQFGELDQYRITGLSFIEIKRP